MLTIALFYDSFSSPLGELFTHHLEGTMPEIYRRKEMSRETILQELLTSLQEQVSYLKPLPHEQENQAKAILKTVERFIENKTGRIYRDAVWSAICMMEKLYVKFDEGPLAREFLRDATLIMGTAIGLRLTPLGVKREFAPPRRMNPTVPTCEAFDIISDDI